MGKLILVSNRLPVSVAVEHGSLTTTESPGGVASGLSSIHHPERDRWIGWTGHPEDDLATHAAVITSRLNERGCAPIFLTESEIQGFYEEASNVVLWPLLHSRLDELPIRTSGWETYRDVNEKFAAAVVAEYSPGDTIWVHDYQLMLVPAAIRRRVPNARIGFFLHVPFPPPEIFRACPWREEILAGLLGADLVGFHTEEFAANFRATVSALGMPEHDGGHSTEVGVFPLGVDAQQWERLADDPHVHELTAGFKAEADGRKILLAVDRLDYTKGILSRLAAIEDLFTKGVLTPDSAVLYQVTVPSRQNLSSYESVKSRSEEMIGRINSAYGGLNVTPIKSSYGTLSPEELCALYRAANVMLVTPLRDGMNLVSKEFVASRPDLDAVLVLSEFAGSAAELVEALKVNPYDVTGMGKIIHQALEMTAVERRYRMERLRERVLGATAERWAASFADRLRACDANPVLV